MKQLNEPNNQLKKKHKKCPDCESNLLRTENEIKNNRCISCTRRKTISISLNRPYTKFKDLPVEEKERLTSHRNAVNKSKKSRNRIYTEDMINHIKEIANENISRKELMLLVCKIYPNKKITASNFNNIISRHNIPCLTKRRDKGFGTETSIVKRKKEESDNNPKYYSTTILAELLYLLEHGVYTYKDLYDIYRNRLAENYSIEDYDKFCSSLEKNYIFSSEYLESLENTLDTDEFQKLLRTAAERINFLRKCDVSETVKEIVQELKNKDNNKDIDDSNKISFESLHKEVDAVLNRKYNIMGCNRKNYYSIQNYIDMFNLLKELASNYNSYINIDIAQHEIMNDYHADIVHTVENEEPILGDNSNEIKLHILRNKRRACEFDQNCLNLLKPFLSSVNLSLLDKAIKELEKQKEFSEHPIYIPKVDMKISEKYEWRKETYSIM